MKIVFALLIVLLLTVAVFLFYCANSCKDIKRLNEEGTLYYCRYNFNYNLPVFRLCTRMLRGSSCSAFVTRNEKGDVMTGRNYDMPHFDDKKNLSGLNVVLRLQGIGKYTSINGVDAAWLSLIKFPYYKGALDDPKIIKLPMVLFPYLCMDGINEKGLTVSILSLDLKEGEKPVYQKEKGKKQLTITELLRLLLDECADIDEAIKMAESVNMINMLNHDYHLFVSDAAGRSVVLEWRYNRLQIVENDACTNFYCGQDDGCDCYIRGQLKELFVKPEHTARSYRYGYGHGYDRFAILTKHLRAALISQEPYNTQMSEEELWRTLGEAAQDYNGMLTSYTQFSVLYNNTQKTATYAAQQDYKNKYSFSFDE